MKEKKQKAYRFGILAEYFAMIYFMLKGYKIVERRYRRKTGEVDLIVLKRNLIVFVEVKARKDLSTALEALQKPSERRIQNTASLYLQKHPAYDAYDIRFDFFAFVSPLNWRHLDNVLMK